MPKPAAQKSTDVLGDVGRLGSLSLVIFSLITLASSVILPFGILSPDDKKSSFKPRFSLRIMRLLKRLSFFRPDLQTAWMFSHILFALPMMLAPLARSVQFATFLVAVCGIPWAVAGWAPFAFMGIEINRLGIPTPPRSSTVTMITSADFHSRRSNYLPPEATDGTFDIELDDPVLRLNHHYGDDTDIESDDDSDEPSSTGELAGIYLGVLNVYTTLPQFLGTLISWVIFSILEPNKEHKHGDTRQHPPLNDQKGGEWMDLNPDGPNAIGVCLFIGALSALAATEMTRRLRYIR